MGYFRHTFIYLLAGLLLLLSPYAVVAAEIAVTLPPLAGLIHMLDKQADVLCLLGKSSDPHHFQLTPRKIEASAQTSLLVRASKDDGGWPLPPQHSHSLDLWPEIDHGWLNPTAVRQVLPGIAKALIDLHPERQTAIESALQQALQQADIMATAWRDALRPLKQAGVLMQHPAWRRLMLAMEVPVLNVLESGHHGHEYGPRQLEQALKTLNAQPDVWIIANAGHSNRALDWLQEHAEHKVQRLTLNGLGTCAQSWPDFMQQNLDRINLQQMHAPKMNAHKMNAQKISPQQAHQ